MSLLVHQERQARVRTAFLDMRPDAVLRAADERHAQAVDFCASGCSAPVTVTEPEPLCAECAARMRP